MGADAVVIDASAAVQASLTDGWRALRSWQLIAPTLLWSEASSGIRQLEYRRDITASEARSALSSLGEAKIAAVASRELVVDAYEIARRLGWAKTYDAEFVALARRENARLLTVDARLARAVADLVTVVGLND